MTERAYARLAAAAAAVRSRLGETTPWLEQLDIVGAGWATVELDRAAAELGEELCRRWSPAARDPLLGATVWRCDAADPERPLQPLLIEPDTEGRLAATLARFGEGVAAIYLASRPDVLPAGATLSLPEPGPLGRGRLVLGGSRWGPHAILVER